jgi:uronate dehydrogenase
MKRLLITGAAGEIGTAMRPLLAHLAEVRRLTDISPIPDPAPGEETITCDLADAAGMAAVVEDCDAIVHIGGCRTEASWGEISASNIGGTFNLYEAARKARVRRIVYASSNHVMGFYAPGERLDVASPPRPDSLYGLSKAFGEDLARLYWDKFGIETVCIRIGSCFPRPRSRRMLATWMSRADLARLIECSFSAPHVGWTVVYGVSANQRSWWDNAGAAHLGWVPRDSADAFRAEVEAAYPEPDDDDPERRWQGAAFAGMGIVGG